MAIGKVDGICKICGEKFTIQKKFYKRRDANAFEENMRGQYDICPDCYREQKYEEKQAAKDAEPIVATVKISKIEEKQPVTIYLTGGTYPVKEQLKEYNYKWSRDDYSWIKSIQREKVKEEILILKEIKETTAFNRMYKEDYEKWMQAHSES